VGARLGAYRVATGCTIERQQQSLAQARSSCLYVVNPLLLILLEADLLVYMYAHLTATLQGVMPPLL